MRVASLNYLKSFKCLAADCEANCCQGWEIRVDAETYLRCSQAEDAELQKTFLQNFVAEEKERISPAVAGRFKLKNGACAFLNDQKLCRLHQSFGPACLPCICYRYPREENIVGDLRERSATISCPEIARLVLLSAEPLRFELEGEEDQWPHLMHRTLDPSGSSGPTAYKSSFPLIREVVLQLLQDDSLALGARLWRLGLLCEKLALLIEQRNFSMLAAELAAFRPQKGSWFQKQKIAPGGQQLAQVIRALCDFELIEKIHFPEYQSRLAEVRDCFLGRLPLADVKLAGSLEQAEKTYLWRFYKKHPRFLENYVVNLVLKQLFPFEEERPVREQFEELLLQYTIARVHLTAVAWLDGGMDDSQAVSVMHTFARTWDANARYRRALRAGFVQAQEQKPAQTCTPGCEREDI